MLGKIFFCCAIIILHFCATETEPVDCADPRIGTAHSRWFFFTPGARPFGMAKPGPCTDASLGNKQGWEAVGYDGRHDTIEGFVSFREFQIGGVAVMATTGPLQTVPGLPTDPASGYRSRFDKKDETASAGYYSVLLKDDGIRAELTSTTRVALHRFTFPASSDSHILIDVGNRQGESGKVLDSFVRRSEAREVEGSVTIHPEYLKTYQPGAVIRLYFVARVDCDPVGCVAFKGSEAHPGQSSISGPGAGMVLNFGTRADEPITLKMGMSYTSIDNARANLDAEAGNMSFDEARAEARDEWNTMLGRIQIAGGKPADRVKFYTGLYHALLGRGVASDVNGDYPRNDGGVGRIPEGPDGRPLYRHFNSDSVWGTFWNLNQLWALAYPDFLSEYVRCHLAVARDCGWLPDSIAASKFVSGVGTNFASVLVSSAYSMGIRDFDADEAFQAVMKNETGWHNRPLGVGKVDTKAFVERGFVPISGTGAEAASTTPEMSQFGASHTLEYSYSAYAAAEFAKALGKKEASLRLGKLADGWKNLFDEHSGFIRPKDMEGKFIADFDPWKPWAGFQEGNACQYTFYVPHDPAGLIKEVGKEAFQARLQNLFLEAEKMDFGGGKTVNAFSGLQNVYNQGNQPSLHIAWLFNHAGQPWRTQHWVRRICDVFYGTEAVHGYGYGQDEDQGQLGAWFVLASMGIFDVQGGTSSAPTMQLSAPLFPEIRIHLHPGYHGGREFVIRSTANTSGIPYIHAAKLNGETVDRCWVPWTAITSGGALQIDMATTPDADWGVSEPPPSGR